MSSGADKRSCELYQRACKVLPGGNTRTSLFWAPHHLYAASAYGSMVVDVDGNERIDTHFNFTTLIHGHSNPAIVERIRQQAGKLVCAGMATELEIELAEHICSRVPTIEAIRFSNSGTEAVLAAIKAARAWTSRPKIAKCEGVYHGSSDLMETSNASAPDAWGNEDNPASVPMSSGTPVGVLNDIVVLPFNNVEASQRLLEAHAQDLAGVIIDPMPVRAGLIPAKPEYLRMIRTVTHDIGAVMISDEVLTFRLGFGGGQSVFGYEPDLTTLGKVIGGGLPIGAVGGREEIMAVFDPRDRFRAWHGGTFNGNPMSMSAGIASMELLGPETFEALNRIGNLAREKVREAFEAAGVPGQVTGTGSLLRIHATNRSLYDYRSFYPQSNEADKLNRLMLYLLTHGFLVNRLGTLALSTITTDAEVELFAQTVYQGLEELAKTNTALQ